MIAGTPCVSNGKCVVRSGKGWAKGGSSSGEVIRGTKLVISFIMLLKLYLRPNLLSVPTFVGVASSHCVGSCCFIFIAVSFVFAGGTDMANFGTVPVCPTISIG